MSIAFIERHGLWTEEQRRRADEIRRRVEADKLRYVRLCWGDTHGYARAKTLTIPAFVSALSSGHNIGVATTTLDSAGARVFASFTRGGGMGIDQMTGSPNITAVPDPTTFQVLPWAPGTVDPVRRVLQRRHAVPVLDAPASAQGAAPARRARTCLRGRRRDRWYLLRVADAQLTERTSACRHAWKPIRTAPVEPGYHYYSESAMDLMQRCSTRWATPTKRSASACARSRTSGARAGRVHLRAGAALAAADNVFLFRTATRQICRRLGHFATFMCRPALKGFYASGWHLHQSLVDAASGANLLAPTNADDALSPLGRSYLAGLLAYAGPATAFTTPTINGYRRFRANSLAPDRAGWGRDHRGAMLRVLSGERDPASRIENRVGEPSANPYLYILSQIVAGLAGIEADLQPPPADDEPYAAERPRLPKSLPEALDALEKESLFRRELGGTFVNYFVTLKRTEAGRYQRALDEAGGAPGDEPTAWEHNEYFDFF